MALIGVAILLAAAVLTQPPDPPERPPTYREEW
jgi:hypothetical protein